MTAVTADLPRILSLVPRHALQAATQRSPDTIANWLAGRTAPNFPDTIKLMQFPEIVGEVLKVAGHETVTKAQVEAAKKVLKILDGN